MFDLGPATEQMRRLVSGVADEQLGHPTPCPAWTVADLLAHIHQFATVFTQNAQKQQVRPPSGLTDHWRVALPEQLGELCSAWRDESAWQGRVSAGGIEMASADNAVVALEELTVHGWDLARATGADFTVDRTSLDQVDVFFDLFGSQPAGEGPFGAPFTAPEGASRLERTIARTGRDPSWKAVP